MKLPVLPDGELSEGGYVQDTMFFYGVPDVHVRPWYQSRHHRSEQHLSMDNMSDLAYASQIYRYYGLEPYWGECK